MVKPTIALLLISLCQGQDFSNPSITVEDADRVFAAIDARHKEQAAYEERQFAGRLNHFARVWNAMAGEYAEKHALNVRLLRELTKAFHALEAEERWPKKKR